MLTLEYIKSVLQSESYITDIDEQVIESDAGYDGIVEILEQRPETDPVILLENASSGNFSANPDGLEFTSQTIWVMSRVSFNEDRKTVQSNMKTLMRRIIAKFLTHRRSESEQHACIHYWDAKNIPWLVTNAGSNNTGYQFTLYFNEPTDMTMAQFSNN